jgi:hypothetical protein
VGAQTGVGLILALASTTLTNLGYLREHGAAAVLPCPSLRRPAHSLSLLLGSGARSWASRWRQAGFSSTPPALALAPLSLVQSIAAGGVGVLAFVSARTSGRRLTRRESSGAALAVLGLVALATSLAGGAREGGGGSTTAVLIWLGATCALALVVLSPGQSTLGPAAAAGVAGGLLFSGGDLSTKLATAGGARSAFVVALILAYALATAVLQVGYQSGGALTVAGLATLLADASPIAAAATVLGEPVPSGPLGGLRAFGFVAVSAGAFLLAQPDDPATDRPVRVQRAQRSA